MRTLSQLRILAALPEVESVTSLSVAERHVPDSDIRALAAAVGKLAVVPPVFHPVHLFDFRSYVPRVVALRLLGVPYLAGKWDSRAFRVALRHALAERPVDVVYIDHLGMSRYLPDIKAVQPRCRTVLDEHNVESDFFKQFADEKTGAKKLVAGAEYRVAMTFESQALRAVDSVIAISDEDATRFNMLAGVHAHLVPVVMSLQRRPRPHPGRPHFCYVGSLRWKPNVLGLDWLCQKVWPLIRERVPEATLEIAGVGLDPDASGRLPVPGAWKVPGVDVVGFLEDLEPLYERSVAMLAPITGGSGVRLKVLEGFRAGIPVVTTPDGAFGLPIQDGAEALIAPDPTGFAERVERLVREDALRDRVREAGYVFLEQHHSPAIAQRAMRRALGM